MIVARFPTQWKLQASASYENIRTISNIKHSLSFFHNAPNVNTRHIFFRLIICITHNDTKARYSITMTLKQETQKHIVTWTIDSKHYVTETKTLSTTTPKKDTLLRRWTTLCSESWHIYPHFIQAPSVMRGTIVLGNGVGSLFLYCCWTSILAPLV